MEKNQLPTPDTEQGGLPRQDAPAQPAEELDELQTKVRALPEARWVLLQRAVGAALGLLCGLLLTYFGSFESTGMFGTVGAVLIALFVPGVIEKRVKRSVQKGRVALMIALGVWLAAYALIMLASGVPLLAADA